MAESTSSPRSAQVERVIAAPPERVWELLTDITRMGEWSPETTGATWVGGAGPAAVGARFRGTNRNGSRSWKTDCTVVTCDPGRAFAFDVKAGPARVARWSYEFEPADGGCRVTERWEDHRGRFSLWISPLVSGVKDREDRNRQTMTETLARLAAAAEGDRSGAAGGS